MTRRLTEKRLILATHNAGKVREVAALLAPWGLEVTGVGDLGLPEPEETEPGEVVPVEALVAVLADLVTLD